MKELDGTNPGQNAANNRSSNASSSSEPNQAALPHGWRKKDRQQQKQVGAARRAAAIPRIRHWIRVCVNFRVGVS
ncbi:hypothetical protein PIB30_079319 [Stylosanthes scabra]|uniref:Uncharacterized protein n=1 Tax=Stylosanthes scabra TaxID=79078 RepID=A0ABU6ST96_9FABA|nr:hypothetical protein [Stylosanthes scabra]